MNLKNLNVVELNAQEAKNTEGGFLPYLLAVVGYIVVESMTNPKSSTNSLTQGYNNNVKN